MIFSTWQTIDTDAQRANKRAKDILETLSAGKVHTKLRLKAIEGDYIFENEYEPVMAGQKRELVVLGEGTRPGVWWVPVQGSIMWHLHFLRWFMLSLSRGSRI